MIYLIHGDNYFESGEELAKLAGDFSVKFPDVRVEVKHGDNASSINEIFAETDSFSFFNSKKLLIVKRLFSNRKTSIIAETAEFLSERKDLDIIFWEEKGADKRSKLYKLINKIGVVREFEEKKFASLKNWLVNLAKDNGIRLNQTLADEIIFKVGTNQAVIFNEFSKLKILLESEKRDEIQQKDLEVLTQSFEASIWEFIDALVDRNHKKALFSLDILVKDKSDYAQTLGMIARELRMIALSDYQEKLGLHPFVLAKLKKNMVNFSKEKIKEMYKKLVNLDFSVKQGKIDEKLGLSLYVISV